MSVSLSVSRLALAVFSAFAVALAVFPAGASGLTASASILPPGEVWMTAPSGLLQFNVTHVSGTVGATIVEVAISMPPDLYSISFLTTPPPGWTYKIDGTPGGAYNRITFYTDVAGIPLGGSNVFDVIVTGKFNDPIPSAPTDVLDDTLQIRVKDSTGNKANVPDASWWRRMGGASITATPSNVVNGQLITVNMTVKNGGSATLLNVVPSNLTLLLSGTANAVLISGPNPESVASIAAGSQASFVWTYAASDGGGSGGTINFNGNASHLLGNTTTATSNTVFVGDLVSSINANPTRIISGASVTVNMIVRNNGGTTLNNLVPQLSWNGTATAVLASGPTPASYASIAPGQEKSFSWTYTVSGNVSDYVQFLGNATAGGVTTPNASSNAVYISKYVVTVSPTYVFGGDTNFILNYTLYNGGSDYVDRITITPPAGYTISGSGHSSSNGWSVSFPAGAIRFTAPNASSRIGPNQNGWFAVRYSSVATVASDQVDMFEVEIRQVVSKLKPVERVYVTRLASGVAFVNVTEPLNYTEFFQAELFNVTANVTAVNGSVKNCNATISWLPSGLSFASGETATHFVGTLLRGENNFTTWSLNTSSLGNYTITVNTTCLKGTSWASQVNVTVKPRDPFVKTRKTTYNACGKVFYRVRLFDVNDSPIDWEVNVSIYDDSGVLRNETSGNSSGGVFDSYYALPQNASYGEWLIRALACVVRGDKNFIVGEDGAEVWRVSTSFSPNKVLYSNAESFNAVFEVVGLNGEGVRGMLASGKLQVFIDSTDVTSSASELGNGFYVITVNAASLSPQATHYVRAVAANGSINVANVKSFYVYSQ